MVSARWLYCVTVWNALPTIQCTARSARLSVHKLFTSCIRRGLVSRGSIVDGDWLPATKWCQRYLPCCQPASEVAWNLGRFLVESVQARGNDFELIPTVNMETRNPVGIEGYFGSEFPAICNHCRVTAAWSRKTLNCFTFFNFFVFFWKKQTSVPKVFIATPIDVLCSNLVKFGWREFGEIVSCLPDKKAKFRLSLQLSLRRGSRPNSSRPAPDNVLRVLQISSTSVDFRRSYSRTREHRQNAP